MLYKRSRKNKNIRIDVPEHIIDETGVVSVWKKISMRQTFKHLDSLSVLHEEDTTDEQAMELTAVIADATFLGLEYQDAEGLAEEDSDEEYSVLDEDTALSTWLVQQAITNLTDVVAQEKKG